MEKNFFMLEISTRDDITRKEQGALDLARVFKDYCREKGFGPRESFFGVVPDIRHLCAAAYKEGVYDERQRISNYLDGKRSEAILKGKEVSKP